MAEFSQEDLDFMASHGLDPASVTEVTPEFSDEDKAFMKAQGIEPSSAIEIRGDAPNVPGTEFRPLPTRMAGRDAAKQADDLRFAGVDRETGADAGLRFNVGRLGTQEDKLVFLNQQLEKEGFSPEQKAEVIDGRLVIPRRDDQGNVTRVQFDEESFTPRDMLDFSSEILPTIGAIIGAGRGGFASKNFIEKAGTAIKAAVGAGAGRVANETFAREDLGLPNPSNLNEIGLAEAGLDLAAGAVSGVGFGLGRNVLQKIVGPFAENQVAKETIRFNEAVVNAEAKHGVSLKPTMGEITMSPQLLSFEAFTRAMPGASPVIRETTEARDAAERQIVEAMLRETHPEANVGPLQPSTQILRDAFDEIAQLKTVSAQERAKIGDVARGEIMDLFSRKTQIERAQNLEVLGEAIRTGVVARKAAFDQTSNELYSRFGKVAADSKEKFGDALEFKTLVTFEKAAPLLKEVTKRNTFSKVVKTSPIGGGPDPRPVVQDILDLSEEQARVRFWRKRVGEVAKDGVPLDTALGMRSRLSAEINFEGGLNNRSQNFLKRLRSAITDSIEAATDKLPTPELRDAYRAANDHYREGIEEFKIPFIQRLLIKDQNSRRFIDDRQIIRAAATSERDFSDAVRHMENDPGALTAFKRGILDDVLERSTFGEAVDLSEFRKNWKRLPDGVRDGIVGPEGKQLIPMLDMAVKATRQKSIDPDEFSDLLLGGEFKDSTAVNRQILKTLDAQKALAKQFQDETKRKFLKGTDLVEEVDPVAYTRHFLENASDSSVAKSVSRLGDGEQLRRVRFQVLNDIFEHATKKRSADDILRGAVGDPSMTFGAESLDKVLNGKNKNKFRAVLGDEIIGDLEDFLVIKARKESAKSKAGSDAVGSFSRGAAFSDFVEGNFLKQSRAMLKWKFVAYALTHPVSRKWVRSTIHLPEGENVLRAIYTSAPFQTEVLAPFVGDTTKAKALDEMGNALGLDFLEIARQGAADILEPPQKEETPEQ